MLTTALVLSGCQGGDDAAVHVPTSTTSGAQVTTDAAAPKTAEAAAYWRIITKFNVANGAYNDVNRQSDLPTVPESYRAAARAVAAAHTTEVAEFRAYDAWPPSVKPLIDQLIARKVILADIHLRMSSITGWESWNKADDQTNAGSEETARLSALIRQALELPPRD